VRPNAEVRSRSRARHAPTQRPLPSSRTSAAVVQATTVVLIACIIVGLWLYANDFIWQRVVKQILL
jgi:type IV secretory pathway VirB2 component (pilin)